MLRAPSVRGILKTAFNWLGVLVMSPAAFTCWLEASLSPLSESVFGFWTNTIAVLPGPPGQFLRRAFYHLTVESCSLNCYIGFGVLFSHRSITVEDEVYVGPYSLIGCARLGKGCLLASRVSLLSGSALHSQDEEGRWMPADLTKLQRIDVGDGAWVGEGSILLANVGRGSLVGAGSLVSKPVDPGVVVAGNPARLLRSLSKK